ncbi:MAG: hypothetical protein QOJ15_11300 [Bradyrhizobium sp.]|nr:hypothetical protein [Bradyrhizobium sp.]
MHGEKPGNLLVQQATTFELIINLKAAYGAETLGFFRRAADYVDRILKGGDPAEMPVEQPTTFRFMVNLRTAKMLGLTIPESVLAQADEVIE